MEQIHSIHEWMKANHWRKKKQKAKNKKQTNKFLSRSWYILRNDDVQHNYISFSIERNERRRMDINDSTIHSNEMKMWPFKWSVQLILSVCELSKDAFKASIVTAVSSLSIRCPFSIIIARAQCIHHYCLNS